MLIIGHSMSCAAPATDCGEVAVEVEKKFEIRSVKLGDVDAAGDAELGGEPVRLLPEHPDSASANKAAIVKRSPERIK
jgi:hypothetical protein